MSRRKSQWKRRAIQAGGVDKIIPQGAKGAGTYLTKSELSNASKGTGEGNTVTEPISQRKEKLVRQWCK